MVFKDLKIGEFFVFQKFFDDCNDWELPCHLLKKVTENHYQDPLNNKVQVQECGLTEYQVTVIELGDLK
jgi:hypothetical protein